MWWIKLPQWEIVMSSGLRMVTLNVLVDEEDANTVLDHLWKETTDPDVCGLADCCDRMGIVIHGYSMLGYSSRGVIVHTAVGVDQDPEDLEDYLISHPGSSNCAKVR